MVNEIQIVVKKATIKKTHTSIKPEVNELDESKLNLPPSTKAKVVRPKQKLQLSPKSSQRSGSVVLLRYHKSEESQPQRDVSPGSL